MLLTKAEKLCPQLCSLFKVSDSTNYDFEMLKKPFNTLFWTIIEENAVFDEAEKYSSSIFGQSNRREACKKKCRSVESCIREE